MRTTFISYSSKDSIFIDEIVKMLKASGGRVFRDKDSILPGQNWRHAIDQGLETCDQLMVFWCCHSKQSEMVRYELIKAIELNKIIIPILCCSYQVDDNIKDFQWIDMKRQLNHSCISTSDHSEIIPPPKHYIKRKSIGSFIPYIFLLIMGILLLVKPFPAYFGDNWGTITNEAIMLAIIIIVIVLFFKFLISGIRRYKKAEMREEDFDLRKEQLISETISNALRETQIDPFYYYPPKNK